MSQFDFDQRLQRAATGAQKYDNRKALFGRDDVIPLWVADMDFACPSAVTAALQARAAHPIYGYHLFPDTLYQAIQAWYLKRFDWQINKTDLMMCPGVVPSIHACINALTEPGDGVIVQPPVYFPFFSAVTETGRKLIENPLLATENGYRMNLVSLAEQARHAKLFILCSPHNPVGRVWDEYELRALLAIAEQTGLVILSDEIHADLLLAQSQHTPLAKLAAPGQVITAISASKTFNIAGLNLSSLVVPDPAQKQAIDAEFKRWHVSAANPFSIVATEAAYRSGEAWLDALLDYVEQTRQQVCAFFAAQMPFIRITPIQGTYLLWLDCRALKMNDNALQNFWVQQAGVGLSPGSLFGTGGNGFMRMNLAAPRNMILQACQQMAEACEQLRYQQQS
ncbi:Putative aminotransferase [Methylophaga frappieri]|uniref:cysteine-S-conjugate beta-lyase n=1 Tax=Methylophaga frappieri (strain ATCC BAA-2434 / DSM 25690 / JAM7) TaxID=754477 RepID=I1YHY9_METFJ|nr:PatB family C-S lyase [Methylophaga frappieri]AFJ02532.1 Putative aminotransferase [Methylophaga frappieri]